MIETEIKLAKILQIPIRTVKTRTPTKESPYNYSYRLSDMLYDELKGTAWNEIDKMNGWTINQAEGIVKLNKPVLKELRKHFYVVVE